jgi:hypothetical protein
MSIRSVSDLAVKRDATPGGTPVASGDPGRRDERIGDTVLSAVPTEVLVLYTTVTGGTLALVVRDHAQAYLPYRWALLLTALALTPAGVLLAYRRKARAHLLETGRPAAARGRLGSPRVPWAEMGSSTLAAAAWFLATPGSPLLSILSRDVAAMASVTILTGAAAILYTGFGRPLQSGTGQSTGQVTEIGSASGGARKPA